MDHCMTTNTARGYASNKGWFAKLSDDGEYLVFFEGNDEKGRTLVDKENGYLRVSRHAVMRILNADATE